MGKLDEMTMIIDRMKDIKKLSALHVHVTRRLAEVAKTTPEDVLQKALEAEREEAREGGDKWEIEEQMLEDLEKRRHG